MNLTNMFWTISMVTFSRSEASLSTKGSWGPESKYQEIVGWQSLRKGSTVSTTTYVSDQSKKVTQPVYRSPPSSPTPAPKKGEGRSRKLSVTQCDNRSDLSWLLELKTYHTKHFLPSFLSDKTLDTCSTKQSLRHSKLFQSRTRLSKDRRVSPVTHIRNCIPLLLQG